MGYIGISLIVASVVWVIVRPPSWMPEPLQVLLRWRGGGLPAITAKDEAKAEAEHDSDPGPSIMVSDHEVEPGPRLRARPADNRTTQDDNQGKPTTTATSTSSSLKAAKSDVSSMPPPPLPKVMPPPPTIAEPEEEQTTPKAVASNPPSINVPSFSLDNAPMAPSSHPAPRRNPTAPGPAPSLGLPTARQPSMMPPPPPRDVFLLRHLPQTSGRSYAHAFAVPCYELAATSPRSCAEPRSSIVIIRRRSRAAANAFRQAK
ncbi:hypothetical protein NXS19_013900 [Fusarium pseudograminearum]|nr:hypothetical protein NXS19_013900 [Fusarium pseudograminearum]